MKFDKDIKNILILGGGFMGARIGLQASLSGFNVVIFDLNEEAKKNATKDFARLGMMLIKENRYKKEQLSQAIESLTWTSDLEKACKGADLVSESVTENLIVKQKVWTEASKHLSSETILTTNTSYLKPSEFSSFSGNESNFCAFHFHDVFTARIVDIMPTQYTREDIPNMLHEFALALNQIPVFIPKETPGYIFNKMFATNLMTAGIMAAEGISSVYDIDKSWMGNFNMHIGPFGMMDAVGLDTVWHVGQGIELPNKDVFLTFLKSNYIDKGKLGIKSGAGFYQYPKPEFKETSFMSPMQ